MRIALPPGLKDGAAAPIIAEGPFYLEHGSVRTLGINFSELDPGDGYRIEDPTRAYALVADKYSVRTEGNVVIFRSDEWDSTFKIRPLELDDADWALEEGTERPETLDKFKELAYEMMFARDPAAVALTAAVSPGLPSQGHTFLTLDDAGNVLELALSNETGIYVRSNGQWFMLDPDADEEEQPTVWNREWVDVGNGAIEIYDASDEAAQTLTRANFEKFIIAE